MNPETATQIAIDALVKERAEFERFAKKLDLDLRCAPTGLYYKSTTQVGWICWLEARRRRGTP